MLAAADEPKFHSLPCPGNLLLTSTFAIRWTTAIDNRFPYLGSPPFLLDVRLSGTALAAGDVT